MNRLALGVCLMIAVTIATPAFSVDRFPPAPDDIFDTDLIELDLGAIVAEKEKLWSFSFYGGFGQADLQSSVDKGVAIASIDTVYVIVNEQFGGGFDLGWTDDRFSDVGTSANITMAARYKFPDNINIGSSRLGIEIAAGHTWNSIIMSQRGFGTTITDNAYTLTPSALLYLPSSMVDYNIPYLGSRRDVFIGIGPAIAKGRHQVELFIPPSDFSSIPDPIILAADNTTTGFQFTVGGEEYYAPNLSFSWQLLYRSLTLTDFEYDDISRGELGLEDEIGGRLVEGEGDIATVWDDFWPLSIAGAWQANPDRPVEIDFSGFTFIAGLRYHF